MNLLYHAWRVKARFLGKKNISFQRPKNSEAKQRKVADEYVRLCGYKNGDNQWG